MNRGPRHLAGFTLITAIFLIVVLSALAAFAVTIGTVQRQTSTFSILGARAFAAAQSGMERGIHGVLVGGGCGAVPAMFALNDETATGFQINLQCVDTAVVEGPDTYSVFSVSSTASQGVFGSEDFISRTINATITDAP